MSLNECIVDCSNAGLRPNRRSSRITFKRKVLQKGVALTPPSRITRAYSDQQVRGVKVRLECRCVEELKPRPVYLEVSNEGKIGGTVVAETERTHLILVPVGLRQVAILHKLTNRYIAMNIQGKLHTTVSQEPTVLELT